ncbi:MAG TPA: 16S rRNA (adenine(1518)-N(6)/adenine(1519)-N(6))-dimethyltransferase RsmA [Gemmatimonadaceae bacterium]|nr:16S rRNA (adenine(1518)-N(6)/adenine(1519)-N(6))-dimethyltransferase RsmA [Gemmatimonadaceae bacterium]
MTEPGERGRRPPPIRKNLGQHFLNDPRILRRIVDALELTGSETVVEIGPGRGSMSALLAPHARELVLIEYDRMLAANLRERYSASPNVRVIEADVLTVNLAKAAGGPFVVVGNVPYYITTPILFHALQAPRPERAVYLVQREVADRIVAAPGSHEYGALSVNVQGFARPRLLFRVASGSFLPPPKVESAVVRIDPREAPAVSAEHEAAFRRFVQDAFGMRRKQMRRVLREIANVSAETAEEVLSTAGVPAQARPETLTPEQFASVMLQLPRAV